jgi:hypothetical protein
MIGWSTLDKLDPPVTRYELFDGPKPLKSGLSHSLNLWVLSGKAYNFAIRAENACGKGEFSPQTHYRKKNDQEIEQHVIAETSACGQIKKVSVKAIGCSLIVEWTRPENDVCFTYPTYIIRVQDRWLAHFHTITHCGHSVYDTECTIPMTDLTLAPFNLKPEEPITVRVAGRDGIEFGPWSDAVSGVEMLAKPQQMSEVAYDPKEGVISWSEVVGGKTPITGYQLFNNAGLLKSVKTTHVSGIHDVIG